MGTEESIMYPVQQKCYQDINTHLKKGMGGRAAKGRQTFFKIFTGNYLAQ